MIPEKIQIKLQRNWGALADAMACNVECRIEDPIRKWEWFIYAQDPENTDCLLCIEKTQETIDPEAVVSMEELLLITAEDAPLFLDADYRPRKADQVYKKLKEGLYGH